MQANEHAEDDEVPDNFEEHAVDQEEPFQPDEVVIDEEVQDKSLQTHFYARNQSY